MTMIEFRIALIILIFYSLTASAVVRKTKTVFSCIMASLIFAGGSVYILGLIMKFREPLTEAVKMFFDSVQNSILS